MDRYQGLRCYQVGQTFEEVGVREKKIQCDEFMMDFVSLYQKKKILCTEHNQTSLCTVEVLLS